MKSFACFLTQTESYLTHGAHDSFSRIACPTLVIGGSDDHIVTGAASVELPAKIPGSELYIYDGLVHGLYEEAAGFLKRVADLCH